MGSFPETCNDPPKRTLGEIVWVELTQGLNHFHVCSYTPINCLRGSEKLNPILQ